MNERHVVIPWDCPNGADRFDHGSPKISHKVGNMVSTELFDTFFIEIFTMDTLAFVTMKNAAKCDK
jgi:hypothetical protein